MPPGIQQGDWTPGYCNFCIIRHALSKEVPFAQLGFPQVPPSFLKDAMQAIDAARAMFVSVRPVLHVGDFVIYTANCHPVSHPATNL